MKLNVFCYKFWFRYLSFDDSFDPARHGVSEIQLYLQAIGFLIYKKILQCRPMPYTL